MMSRLSKRVLIILAFLAVGYVLLLIPDSPPLKPSGGESESFAWNRDAYWTMLENKFREAREAGCFQLEKQLASNFSTIEKQVTILETAVFAPQAPEFMRLQDSLFNLGMLVAACPDRLEDYIRLFNRVRTVVKDQSVNWDINSAEARDCIYRLLYGGRMAVEEIMLQSPEEALPETITAIAEPSATPSGRILGVNIHSGDILVSRGGAPTSALIARGNDYPGNFSHAALVHVDENTGQVSIIESHIEKGVTVARIEDYLEDTKLRVMVLRLRNGLPDLQKDPLLPHRAARYALQRALNEHIPYDFSMDINDPSKLFCSEVISDAYRSTGVRLWSGLSRISDTGVKTWLAAFGVRHFITQEPSDLEYDPQLRVVAEWRDYRTLRQDRLDNAVVDVMLEKANAGEDLKYDLYKLPLARILKLYSVFLNWFGEMGPIPEGMNAIAALKNEWFSRQHKSVRDKLDEHVRNFKRDKGYSPPYWEIVKLARQAMAQSLL